MHLWISFTPNAAVLFLDVAIQPEVRFIAEQNSLMKIDHYFRNKIAQFESVVQATATAGSDAVQSGRPIFDDFFQHLWPYIGNNTANVVFQMVKRLWLIRIDQ
ncbi:hypothetical protein TNCV_1714101 [Trichonephila clavipes]|nr:hypothetical protein TNCV_1714101 [Trichonephila clavipes]